MSDTRYYYKVFEKRTRASKIVCRGHAKDVCDYLDISYPVLSACLKKGKHIILDQHYITWEPYKEAKEEFDERERKKQEKKERAEKSKKKKFDNLIDEIELMLKMHKNTLVYKDIKRVVKCLEADGYFVSAEYRPEQVRYVYVNGKKYKKEIFPEYWYIELTKDCTKADLKPK